jgi:DNA polymerase-3 subunit alpha
LVDALVNPDELQAKSIREVHIRIDPNLGDDQKLTPLRDFLFESSGGCSVYLHVQTPAKQYVIRAANQIQVSANDDFMEEVAQMPGVIQAWKE